MEKIKEMSKDAYLWVALLAVVAVVVMWVIDLMVGVTVVGAIIAVACSVYILWTGYKSYRQSEFARKRRV